MQGKKKCQQVGLNRQDLGSWVALGKKSKTIYLGIGFSITWMKSSVQESSLQRKWDSTGWSDNFLYS